MNTEQEKIDLKNKNKKRIIIVFIVLSVLGIISYILLENPQLFEIGSKDKVTSMYSDELYSYNFYPCHENFDVTTDERYMQLDRYIHYKNGSVTEIVSEDDLDGYNDAIKFFVTYFKTVISGDEDTYNTYFTDRYYTIYDPYLSFKPQMIYDIEVEQLSEIFNDDGTTKWTFNIKYRIHRNNGSFRNDIDSDSSKTLYYELIGDRKGNVKIAYITYYKNVK